MTKFEKKILDRLKDHRMVLAYLVITVLNLYLRKVAVWWNADGIECYYDGHSHMVQGQLWWLIMRIGMLFPILPVHFMKWVSAVGDFALAGAGAYAISRGAGKAAGRDYTVRGLVFYAIILIMPFTLMRGIVWGLTDSLGISCALVGTLLADSVCRGKSEKAGLVVRTLAFVLAMLFCPMLIIPFWIEGVRAFCKKDFKRTVAVACSTLATAVLAGILGIVNGSGFMQGFFGQVNFIMYEALNGAVFTDFKAWFLALAGYFALPVTTAVLLCFCRSDQFLKQS